MKKAKTVIGLILFLAAVTALSVAAERLLRSSGIMGGTEREVFLKIFPRAAAAALIIVCAVSLIRRMGRLTLKKLDTMEGHEFEYACAGILRTNGFKKVQVTQGSGDFGVDITAEKKRVKYAVQCKRYDKKLNNSAIQEVIGGLAVYGCEVGAVMTNSYFTAPAKRLAEMNGVILWDRDALSAMLDKRGTKKAVRESLTESTAAAAPEDICADTVEAFLAAHGISADIENVEYLEDTCELLIEIKPQTGVRIEDIRSLSADLADHGGWEYAACVFPSKTAGTVGIEIPLPQDTEYQ